MDCSSDDNPVSSTQLVALRGPSPPLASNTTYISRVPFEVLQIIFATHLKCSIGEEERAHQWFAYSQVCHQWREVSLRSPHLWSRITQDLSAPWVVAHFERSGTQPIDVDFSCDAFQAGNLFSLLRFNMHRVRGLSFVWGPEDSSSGDPMDEILDLPAPSLERFLAVDETGNIDWELPDAMFAGNSPRLHIVDLSQGFRIRSQCSLLPHLHNLSLGGLISSIGIVPIIARTPSLETLKFTMLMSPDDTEAIEEAMAELSHNTIPIELPNLKRLEIEDGFVTDFLRIMDLVRIPLGTHWRIHFEPTTHVRDISWFRALDIFSSHVHRRQESCGPLSDLHVGVGQRCMAISGWLASEARANWYNTVRASNWREEFSAFVLQLRYSYKLNQTDTSRSKSIPFDEVDDMLQRLPLNDLTNAWLETNGWPPRHDPDLSIQCDSPSRWRPILSKLSGVRTLRLSRGVIYGVLRALTFALDGTLSSSTPAEVQRLELDRLQELTLDIDDQYQYPPEVADASPSTVTRYLYRYVLLRYQMLLPLQIIRHDLCSTICSSETTMEALAYLVEEGVHCIKCGKSILTSKFSMFVVRSVAECRLPPRLTWPDDQIPSRRRAGIWRDSEGGLLSATAV